MNSTNDFIEKYHVVFDEDGNIKACGRYACMDLILACEKITGRKGDFGDPDTGYTKPEAIKALYQTLTK